MGIKKVTGGSVTDTLLVEAPVRRTSGTGARCTVVRDLGGCRQSCLRWWRRGPRKAPEIKQKHSNSIPNQATGLACLAPPEIALVGRWPLLEFSPRVARNWCAVIVLLVVGWFHGASRPRTCLCFHCQGVCFKKCFSYAGFEQQPKRFENAFLGVFPAGWLGSKEEGGAAKGWECWVSREVPCKRDVQSSGCPMLVLCFFHDV